MIWQILQGIWPPLLVAVPLLAAAWWSRNLSPAARSRRGWVVPAAMAGGFFAAFVALESLPPTPWNASSARPWLAWGAVAAGIIGVADALRRWPAAAWGVAVLGLPAVVAWLAFDRLAANAWSGGETALHIATTALVAAAITGLAAGPSERTGPLALVQLTMIGATTGHVLGTGGSAFFGQLAGALTAVCGASAVMAAYNPGMRPGRGGALVFGGTITALLAMGWHLAEVPTVPIALCVVAPLALPVPTLLSRASWSVRTALTLLATAIPLGAAATMISAAAAADPYGY